MKRYGLICGNGRFPILALQEARKLGHEVIAIGIKDEARPEEIEPLATRAYWITVAQLGKLIEILHREEVKELILAGQVKHASIFSSLRPDWRLFKLLASLKERNTEALIGGVIGILQEEGIQVLDSTALLKPLLATAGSMTKRAPNWEEERDISYGRSISVPLSGFDLGQSVAICDRACVALEAMEGTDAMLRRAAALVNGKRLTLVKGSRRREHLLFDVPVTGPRTIAVMKETGTTVLAVDAGRTLMLDREEMLAAAEQAGICVAGYEVSP